MALSDFFGEVVGVKSGDCHFHVPYQVFVSLCFFVEHKSFFDEMHGSIRMLFDPVIDRGRVFEVASEPVDLFAQDHRHFVLCGKSHHFVESDADLLAACRLGDAIGFNDGEFLPRRVLGNQFFLRVERVASFFLFFGRNPHVCYRLWFFVCCHIGLLVNLRDLCSTQHNTGILSTS
ncbi:MAG TPA: hypothetical protein VNK70_03170 [Candidatus Paceibacterota bacterium]|nr:hypothetical protein [Candidatus Paceibacterota bacterium]